MKKLVLIAACIIAGLLTTVSCYDDSALNIRLDYLQERIIALGKLGDELTSISTLISKIEMQAFIKKVNTTSEGVELVFADGTSTVLKNGDKGENGNTGKQGETGERGKTGDKGVSPVISVKKFEGSYYWTVDGEWMLDENGDKVSASQVTPTVKIENSILFISYDKGTSWIKCGTISTNIDNSLFSSFAEEDGIVTITLADGTELEFPKEGTFTLLMSEETHEVVAGDTIKVAYTLSGAEAPEVYCHAEGGFYATVEKETDLKGTIVIPVTQDTETGRVLVYATDGNNTLVRGFEIKQEVLASGIKLFSDPIVTYASIAMNYCLENIPSGKTANCGICWALTENPTTEQNKIQYPSPLKDTIYHAVPATMLDLDQTYHFRVYMVLDGKTSYSEDYACCLAEQPSAITFNWTEEPAANDLPDGIKVYKTTDQLNGYPFNAWYAIADPAKMELRINLEQGTLKTLETQYAEDKSDDKPCVLTNGGYFYQTSAVGRTIIGGKGVSGTELYDVTGTDKQRYPLTRGTIGFTKDGIGNAYWAYTTSFYSGILPHIAGQTPFLSPGNYSWMKSVSWSPDMAISAGPMLIKDGKILPEFTKTSQGYFLNNFEQIASDIFSGHGSDTDRTAIGYTEDGKIILFVCDGRCSFSQGADLDQLAQIMKGLGCSNALNLDGGGSTAMLVKGTRVNTTVSGYGGSSDNRAVATNIGFYPRPSEELK